MSDAVTRQQMKAGTFFAHGDCVYRITRDCVLESEPGHLGGWFELIADVDDVEHERDWADRMAAQIAAALNQQAGSRK
jgi:hypothetical protein